MFVIACFFAVLSITLIPQVKTDVSFMELAPSGIPEVETLLEYSEKFGGGTNFNAILIETESQGLTYPETIEAIYMMENKIRDTGVSVTSIISEIKKANDILGRNEMIDALSSYLGIEEIIFDQIAENGLVDKEFSKTLILVTLPAGASVEELERLVNAINDITSQAEIPHNGRVSQLAGQDVVTVEVNKQLMGSQVQSMATALLLVLSILILGFNSSLIGFTAIIPVLFVLIWEFGALVTLNIPLSIINVTVASIMVGTGIDYSIQTTQRVREEIANGLSKVDALRTTIETSGWSVIGAATTTMVSLLATFAVSITVLHQFSIVVALLISCSFIAVICILPTLLTSRFIK
jgi:predicted RND superfamily exporter protein